MARTFSPPPLLFSRLSQIFINFGDGGQVLDRDFAPFAEVVKGIDAVDSIFKIGEAAPGGKGPQQSDIASRGNAFLDDKFPQLTRLVSMRIVDEQGHGERDGL